MVTHVVVFPQPFWFKLNDSVFGAQRVLMFCRRCRKQVEDEDDNWSVIPLPEEGRRNTSKVRRTFRAVVKQLICLLRIRKRWAQTGQFLQNYSTVFDQVKRTNGVLYNVNESADQRRATRAFLASRKGVRSRFGSN